MKKYIDCGKLRFELSEALPNGTEVEIWESDNLIRPSSRVLRVTLSPDATRRLLEELNGMAVTSKLTVYQPESPQPVATLCEDIEILLKHLDDYFSGVALESFKNNVRYALTAERKRQAELDPLLRHVVLWYKRKVNQETGADEILIHNIANYLRHTDALDAFDKGAENG